MPLFIGELCHSVSSNLPPSTPPCLPPCIFQGLVIYSDELFSAKFQLNVLKLGNLSIVIKPSNTWVTQCIFRLQWRMLKFIQGIQHLSSYAEKCIGFFIYSIGGQTFQIKGRYFGSCPTEGRSLSKPWHKDDDVFLQVLALFSGTIGFDRNGTFPGVLI